MAEGSLPNSGLSRTRSTKTRELMRVLTPAKINTLLHILRHRDDGYHELFSHFVPVDIFDMLEVEYQFEGGILFDLKGCKLNQPKHNNLVLTAAAVFEKALGQPLNLKISLTKNIPPGSGLGGGSGNAGGMLVILNKLLNQPFPLEKLKLLAVEIGADVPFFVDPRPSEIHGIGSVTKYLNGYPLLPLLVVKPAFSISTSEAYRECIPLELNSKPHIRNEEDLIKNLCNRFEESLLPKFPELQELKTLLIKYGALGASVSGSGSSVFGIFGSKAEQLEAARILQQNKKFEVFPCMMLEKHSY